MNVSQQTKIAVVGVSQDEKKYGARIFRDLLQANYNVVGVNHKGGVFNDQKLFITLDEIDPKPELVITVVPPKATLSIVQECIKIGIKKIWMQPGSESKEAIDLAKSSDIELIHQACFMVNEQLW
jgi:uncharacterized protein